MLEKFARYPLTFGPSYIQPLERLSAYLGNAVRLYAKREDCNSGLAFGGNKLRKLEFIVPDAIASGTIPWSRRGSRRGSALLLLRLEPLHRTGLRGLDALDDLLIGGTSIVVASRCSA